MSKVDIKRLDSVTKNDTTATEQINDNFQALQAAIENTVSRDGTVPNYMDADLDLNSYRIINAGAPVEGKDVVTLEYFEEKAGGAIEAAAEAKASASKAASSAQSALVASNNAVGQLAQAEGLLTAAEGQLADTKQYVDAARADISQTVEDSIEYVEQEAVKAATEVVGSVVGQYTDRAETAAKNAEADASRTAESANRASASATSAATSASEAEAIAGEISVYNFKNKITNCITEIPQDIKLELNNGTLTLKAGSKVYVPNGAGKFDVVTIANDTVVGQAGTVSGAFAFYRSDNGTCYSAAAHVLSSGATAPSNPVVTTTWYDTTNNVIKAYDGTAWRSNVAFPLCRFTNNNSSVTSIDQVFNGFGYIGSTVFALPGVKGLIPNGRNADGSLRNVEFVVSSVRTCQVNQYTGFIRLSANSIQAGTPNLYLNDVENRVYDGSTQLNVLIVGPLTQSSGVVTSFTPKLPFHAVDQNDFNKLDEEVVKTSGNQTIDGTKTFNAYIVLNAQGGNEGAEVSWRTGNQSVLQDTHVKQDMVGHLMRFFAKNSAGTVIHPLQLDFENGNAYGNTVPATANNTALATTAWVNSSFKNNLIPNVGSKVDIVTAVSSTNGYTAPSSGFVSVQTSYNGTTTTLSVGGVVVAQAHQYSGDSHGSESKQLFALVGKGQVVKTDQPVQFGVFVPFK